MKRTMFKSMVAILAGFSLAFAVSVITDIILEKSGMMKTEPFSDNPSWLIIIVIIYRTMYNVGGCYLTARLAPNRLMRHAMIIGFIGLVFGTAGTIVMWDKPPHWYPITLLILILPGAWLGGKLAELKIQTININ